MLLYINCTLPLLHRSVQVPFVIEQAMMTGKSSPLDVLPASLLRSSVSVFALILAHMANLSFAERCFTTAFKAAQMLPLLKKAGLDRDDMSSYRPITILTTASKVIERLFLNRLRPQLLDSRNFSRLQLAYRRGHSTETALLHVLNGVYAAADQKSHCSSRVRHVCSLQHH